MGRLPDVAAICGLGTVEIPKENTMARKPKINSVSKYLKACPSSTQKAEIRKILKARMVEAGVWRGKWPLSSLNDMSREILADCIFEVEDRLESKSGGQPDNPVVVSLRDARNRVYDDLRWND